MRQLNIKPTPYVSIPQGMNVKDHWDLESKIRNGEIDSHVRSQSPIHMVGWVCFEVQPDYTLKEVEAQSV